MSRILKGGFTIKSVDFIKNIYNVYNDNGRDKEKTISELKNKNKKTYGENKIIISMEIIDKIVEKINAKQNNENQINENYIDELWNELKNIQFKVKNNNTSRKKKEEEKKMREIINQTIFEELITHIIEKKNEKANQNSTNNNEPITSNNTISSEAVSTDDTKVTLNDSKINIDGLIQKIQTFDNETLKGYIEESKNVLKSIRENIKIILESNLTNSEVTVQLQKQMNTIKIENDRLREKITQLEADIDDKDAKIVDLENQINENNTMYDNLRKDYDSAKEQMNNIKNIQQENNNIETELRNQMSSLKAQLTRITNENQSLINKLNIEKEKVVKMTREINKINTIRMHFNNIVAKTEQLSENNATIKDEVERQVKSINNKQPQQGGYQYKSKNKTRSKRMLKLNRFGLLKSKSKTRKGKKKLKVKKNKKSVKGGMKTRSKPKRKSKKGKKTRKGKKKNNKRK